MTDSERLQKLQELLDFKRLVHTNPVEVGTDDLEWLIKKAGQSIEKQARMEWT